jgi:hypothetical protein
MSRAGTRCVRPGQANNLALVQTDILQNFVQRFFYWGWGETNFVLTSAICQLCKESHVET